MEAIIIGCTLLLISFIVRMGLIVCAVIAVSAGRKWTGVHWFTTLTLWATLFGGVVLIAGGVYT